MTKKRYLSWFVFVYALYVYLNKGVAYTYLAEFTWLAGVVLIIRDRKQYQFSWDRRSLVLTSILLISLVYMIRGFLKYPVMDVIRDSFMFNYGYFVFVIYLFRNDLPLFKEKLYKVYKWFPLIVTIGFLLRSFIPFFAELKVFGEVPLLQYKNGDLALHLLICTFFMMNGHIQSTKRFEILNYILIAYLFLIAATFNRGGMLSYIIGMAVFLFFSKDTVATKKYVSYLKYVPFLLIVALPLYLSTKVEDKGQARNIGISQLTNNISSIVDRQSEGDLNDNVLWRLAWWGKIVDYTVMGDFFFQGKGLGVNLAVDDGIPMEDESLRSPHNFHLNVLARFGVPFFLLWLYWIFSMIIRVRAKPICVENLSYLAVIIACLSNASFDVYLEGPMGALPFWTFVGLLLATETFKDSEEKYAETGS